MSGVLAGGLVALALGMALAAVLATRAGVPGPGFVVLTGHLLAAVVAVAAQRMADRTNALRGAFAALVVVGVAAVALAALWLA